MVSIIVPLYNAEQYLEECLQCLINQTYPDIEIVLVNDGSTDNTLKICEQYRENDNRIQIINQQNAGVSTARNRGVRESHGEYITFVDGDDTVSPTLVEKLLCTSEVFSADLVYCGINLIDLRGNKETGQCRDGARIADKHLLFSEFFTNANTKLMLYGPYNKLFSRKLASELSFDTDIRVGEDLLYVYKAIIKSECIAECSDCLYNYIKRENSATTQSFNVKKLDYLIAAERIVELSKTADMTAYACATRWFYANVLDFCRLIAADKSVKKQKQSEYNRYIDYLSANKKEMWVFLNKKKKISYFLLMYCPFAWRVLKRIGYKI